MSQFHMGINMGHDRSVAYCLDALGVTLDDIATKTTPTCLSSYLG